MFVSRSALFRKTSRQGYTKQLYLNILNGIAALVGTITSTTAATRPRWRYLFVLLHTLLSFLTRGYSIPPNGAQGERRTQLAEVMLNRSQRCAPRNPNKVPARQQAGSQAHHLIIGGLPPLDNWASLRVAAG